MKIKAGTTVTPEMARRLAAEFEMRVISKEIETIDEWLVIAKELLATARGKGKATSDSLIEAFKQLFDRMETRKKRCFKDKTEINKTW